MHQLELHLLILLMLGHKVALPGLTVMNLAALVTALIIGPRLLLCLVKVSPVLAP